MPYKIIKLPGVNRYKVINTETREVKAKRTTLAKAKKQVKLLEGIEHRTLKPRKAKPRRRK